MFGKKKTAQSFSKGASRQVQEEWVYRVHAPAREMLDAAAARCATAEEMADYIEGLSKTNTRRKFERAKGDLSSSDVFVATRDFHLKELRGAASIKLLVPKGIKVTHGEIGHSDIYDMNDFSLKGYHRVNIFNDIARILNARGCKPQDYDPPPPTAAEIAAAEAAKKAATGAQVAAEAHQGLPQTLTVRRISLKPKAS
jgi:hypothetical protein